MGKGDKKSRRGKIIIGSTGVRRPKSSKRKGIVQVETTPVGVIKEVKKPTEKPKAETKPKVKLTEVETDVESVTAVTPAKTVKKAVKKTKVEDIPE
jgi:ribosomal small subunit protein bTHX